MVEVAIVAVNDNPPHAAGHGWNFRVCRTVAHHSRAVTTLVAADSDVGETSTSFEFSLPGYSKFTVVQGLLLADNKRALKCYKILKANNKQNNYSQI